MTNEKKEGFFAKLFAGRACCCCNTQIEEVSEADAPETKPKNYCEQAKSDDKSGATTSQKQEQTCDHKVDGTIQHGGGDCCCQGGKCK